MAQNDSFLQIIRDMHNATSATASSLEVILIENILFVPF